MTSANKVTLIRVLMIPIMIVIINIKSLESPIGFFSMNINEFIFAVLFVIASFTDMLDGYLARKHNQVTTFGKFLDPIADKVLVVLGLLYLMNVMPLRVPLWAVMIVIIREFLVTGIRLLAIEKQIVIAASIYGKFKTMLTMMALTWLLFNDFGLSNFIGDLLFYSAISLTIISGLEYLIKNKDVVLESI
jgi:CDP-diacylglycerol---glycerol-3-phosphate 3-phosphatidyltransferase